MPDFDRFRGRENAEPDNGFNDGFNDDFDDGFNDDFNDGFDDSGEVADGYDANGENGDSDGLTDRAIQDNDAGSTGAENRPTDVSFRESLGTLFRAISERFGKGGRKRDAGISESDASFVESYDSSLDEGFMNDIPQQEETYRSAEPVGHFSDDEPAYRAAANDYPLYQERETFPTDDPERSASPYSRDDALSEDRFRAQPDDRGIQDYSGSYYRHRDDPYDVPSEDDDDSDDEWDSDEEEQWEEEKGGLFAALGDAFRKFRRRLPSFRPKVYVLPEPSYKPEDDGIQKPTLASDIRRMIEERNRTGETEQEYEKMRSYISSVSTDARLRPQDIRQPENIGEVRAAENELYDLIDMINSSNERQRSMIGVYETTSAEDPYNFRGINNSRQFFTDMDAYSFDMGSPYGFESEEKITPGRNYSDNAGDGFSSYNSDKSVGGHYRDSLRQKDFRGNDPGGMSDDFGNSFGRMSDDSGDGSDGLSDDFDNSFGEMSDDFGDGRGEMSGEAAEWDDGFGKNAFDESFMTDEFNGSGRNSRRVKVRSRSVGKGDGGEATNEGYAAHRAGRVSGRGTHRRGRR